MKNIVAIAIASVMFFSCEKTDLVVVEPKDWVAMGLSGFPIKKLVIGHPYLYVCAGTKGLFRRNVVTMSGWEFLGFADSTLFEYYQGITDIDVKGTDLLVSYVGNFDSAGTGLYRSLDDGKTFSRSDSGIANSVNSHSYIQSLERSPLDPTIGVAVYGIVYMTTDGGTTWNQYDGLPRSLPDASSDLQWNPHKRNEVWWFGMSAGLSSFSLRSNNSGLTWETLNFDRLGIPAYAGLEGVTFDATDSNIVYVSILGACVKSTNSGNSWVVIQPLNVPLQGDPKNHGLLYLASSIDLKIIQNSRDGGETLRPIPEQLNTSAPHNSSLFVVDPATGILFAATSEGIYLYKP